jgi:hypothetical protein
MEPGHEFWNARPELRHLYDFAKAREVSPWALFACVMARMMTLVSPRIVLPPPPAKAPLNWFVNLVGGPSSGKTAVQSVAEDAVNLHRDVYQMNLGSGPGLTHEYAARIAKKGVVRTKESVLFVVDEVRKLSQTADRRGETLLSVLCSAWSGAALGEANADPTRRLVVERMTYRMALIVGVQPINAGVLLDDAGSGTPQRFLWMPATDPWAPEVPPVEPEPWDWWLPKDLELPYPVDADGHLDIDRRFVEVDVCEEAKADLRADRARGLRGKPTLLKAKAGEQRLRVATALAIYAMRSSVTAEDWALAAAVMRVSDRTCKEVGRTLNARGYDADERIGESRARRAIVEQEVVERHADVKVDRLAEWIVEQLHKAGTEGLSTRQLKAPLNATRKKFFEAALEALLDRGEVVGRQADTEGTPGTRYYLAALAPEEVK